jgi:arsenate reductase (thioredoxin)
MKTILFACVHNAGRSQMAAAMFNKLANSKQVRAISAGTKPANEVHPAVIEVMHEVGIDLTHSRPQRLTPELAGTAQVLVTMGCGEECPFAPGVEIIDWQIADPNGEPVERVREIRDEILEQVKMLLERVTS